MSFEQSYAEFSKTEASVIRSKLESCFEPTLVLYSDSWQIVPSDWVPASLWFSQDARLSSLLEKHIPCAHWRSDTCDCTEDCQLPR
jgi:hypothetical protein